MRNKLYATGCSFTYGHIPDSLANDPQAIQNYTEKPCPWTWAGHMKSHFDECVNEAWGGGSNHRMIRRCHEFFSSVEDPSNWVAVIQLTDPYRFEYFDNVIQNHVGIFHSNEHVLLDDRTSNSKTIDLDDVIRRSKTPVAHRMLFLNYDLIAIELFEKLLALTKFLESKNIEYFVTAMSTKCAPEIIANDCSSKHAKDLFNLLDFDKVVTLRPLSHQLVNSEDFESPTDLHPSKHGHEKIYRYIYNHLKTRGIVE